MSEEILSEEVLARVVGGTMVPQPATPTAMKWQDKEGGIIAPTTPVVQGTAIKTTP